MKNAFSDKNTIKRFLRNLEEVEGELFMLDREKLVELICETCEFYSPEKERLECGAFKILANLISKGIVTREMLQSLGSDLKK